jgi:hypothetical protein
MVRTAGHTLVKIIEFACSAFFLCGAAWFAFRYPLGLGWSAVLFGSLSFGYGLRFTYYALNFNQSAAHSPIGAGLAIASSLSFTVSGMASLGAAFYESFLPYALLFPICAVMAWASRLLAQNHTYKHHAA